MNFDKIKLPFKIKRRILALGPQTNNTVCFGEGNYAYVSRLHQNLNNPRDYLSFENDVKCFFKKRPRVIAYDLHPEYQSTKYALNLSPITYHLSPTQHHHAHIASCMVENNLKNEKVIGVVFDGTGLGTDGNIWGAEFLICNYSDFKRRGHLKEVPLLGSEKAILEPWRIAVAWLYLIYKDKFLNLGFDWVKKANMRQWPALKNIYLSGFSSPLASSMGRLFDAVASLVLDRHKVNFEAELAIRLQKIAMRYRLSAAPYRFDIIRNNHEYTINPTRIFKEIIIDLKAKEPKEKIAYRFHLTVAQMIRKMALILKKENRINKIVLSGGVFQNNLLLRLALDLLYEEGFKVFTHKELSCNDSGISLGQVAVGNFRS